MGTQKVRIENPVITPATNLIDRVSEYAIRTCAVNVAA